VKEIDDTLKKANSALGNSATIASSGGGSSMHNNNSNNGNDHHEQEEILRKIFVRARQKALDEINDALADYRNKRIMGIIFIKYKLYG